MIDKELIEDVRKTLAAYLEGLAASDTLTLYLVSGEKLHIKGAPGQDIHSIWYDLTDIDDNDISVRLDQIAAIRDVGKKAPTAFVV